MNNQHLGKATEAQASHSTLRSQKINPNSILVPIDGNKDIDDRPLVGRDIDTFVKRRRLERMQAVEALAMASPGIYSKLTKQHDKPLPFELELLLRLHLKQEPNPDVPTPMQVFNRIYGDLLAQFPDPAHAASARILLYERFAAMLGRTVYSAYRWFKITDSGNYGAANGALRRLFALTPQEPKAMRRELENLARTAFKVRGRDFDAEFPLPDPNNPPEPRRPGPPTGARARRTQELSEEVIARVVMRKRASKPEGEPVDAAKDTGSSTPGKSMPRAGRARSKALA